MNQLRLLAVPLLLALCHPAAAAAIQCGDACQRAMRDGHALEMQGKYQQALDAYRDAEKAEPLASPPISMAADLMLRLSPQIKPEKLKAWRDTVRAMATRAARLAPDDPIAQETLRQLDDDGVSPLRQLNARAAALQAEAENRFSERRYQEALPKYEAAMRADPRSSLPWVGAGDCHFMQQDWARAETLFRRATEIEPHNAQAWRFLSDALLRQDKRAAAEAALLSGIAADPAQRPNWTKLDVLRSSAGKPLTRLALKRGVSVEQDAGGALSINIDQQLLDTAALPDRAFRVALGTIEARLRTENKNAARSAYDIELQTWRQALTIAEELEVREGQGFSDPAFQRMQALARAGQLEPAILLLQFRQSYRPALEAWLAAHPDGVREFVERHALQP